METTNKNQYTGEEMMSVSEWIEIMMKDNPLTN